VIVDGHVHVWPRWPHSPPVPDAKTRGGGEHLLFEMDACGVDRAIVVSAAIEGMRDNNDYVGSVVAAHPDRLVQLVDVDSRWSDAYHRPGAADRLCRLVDRYQPVGLSHYLGPVDDGWLMSREGIDFFGVAAERGLIASLAAPGPWHEDLWQVARRFPELCLLVNHLGGATVDPAERGGMLRSVLGGSDLPNLLVKVSGLYYGHPKPWDYPYTDRMHLVRCFYDAWGPERLVWSSDFPSNLAHVTYRQSLELIREHAPFLSAGELDGVLGGNVRRWLPTEIGADRG